MGGGDRGGVKSAAGKGPFGSGKVNLTVPLEMLEAIVGNDDNLTYGSIASVCTGPDESSTSLTDDGVDDLSRMITCARRSPAEWDVSGGWRPRFSFWADCDTSFA